MKSIIHKSFLKKIFIAALLFAGFIWLMNSVIMPWYVSSPELHVPNVVGLSEPQAFQTLRDSDLVPIISDTTFDQKVPRGAVILQRPEANEIVKIKRRVYLFISGGIPIKPVPELNGKSVRDARFTLERLGLELGKITRVPSENPKGMIFGQQYATGTPLQNGDSVGVTVSLGKIYGLVTVPNLIGKSLTEATKIIADSSLKVGKINYQRSFSLLPNTVLDQYPSEGNKVNPGGTVDLFVTKSAESSKDNQN